MKNVNKRIPCFAWNFKQNCCRCLVINQCNNGMGNKEICHFYKPITDKHNIIEMVKFKNHLSLTKPLTAIVMFGEEK